MKAVVQRVTSAYVYVDSECVSFCPCNVIIYSEFKVSSIGKGLCVLVGLCRDDGKEDVEYIVRKLLNLRLFENPETQKRWDKSVKDLQLEILCVSQVFI
jgi:D-tyrosyl-tRNA(Tyr) deacylase